MNQQHTTTEPFTSKTIGLLLAAQKWYSWCSLHGGRWVVSFFSCKNWEFARVHGLCFFIYRSALFSLCLVTSVWIYNYYLNNMSTWSRQPQDCILILENYIWMYIDEVGLYEVHRLLYLLLFIYSLVNLSLQMYLISKRNRSECQQVACFAGHLWQVPQTHPTLSILKYYSFV